MGKRQMGTQQKSVELQVQIKELAAKLGWSRNRLAEKLYVELYEFDDENELSKFTERLKKELQRPTTKIERLQAYLEILYRHQDVQALEVVVNRYVPIDAITPSMRQAMKKVSREVDLKVKEVLPQAYTDE